MRCVAALPLEDCSIGWAGKQGDLVLFRESPSTGYSVKEENGKFYHQLQC